MTIWDAPVTFAAQWCHVPASPSTLCMLEGFGRVGVALEHPGQYECGAPQALYDLRDLGTQSHTPSEECVGA